jgi:menaquinone-dependent protoporphyrinogen IX oxidase
MKGLILYQGKYGATLQYAEWLGQALHMPIRTPDLLTKEALAEADYLLMGTSVYTGKFLLRDWLQKHAEDISGKKLFLFMVATVPAEEKATWQRYLDQNLPQAIRQQCQLYYLPGRLRYKKLSWPDKMRLRLDAMFTKDARERERMLADYNGLNKELLTPLLEAVKLLDPDQVNASLQKGTTTMVS